MGQIKSFKEIINRINAEGNEIEILVPAAGSESSLAAVAAFINSVKIPVKASLIGDPENIEKLIAGNGLSEILNRTCMDLIPAETEGEAYARILDMMDGKKSQLLVKENATPDRLMNGPDNIISHMRIFEAAGRIVIMSDGGINVVSNISDEQKRAGVLNNMRKNSRALAALFDIEEKDIFEPACIEGLAELRREAGPRFADASVFPRFIQFTWIGPANILYKAAAGTPWEPRFENEISFPCAGAGTLFTRSDTGAPFIVAAPEIGAGFKEKAALMQAALRAAGNLGISGPKIALLDFTEQYAPYMNTPSIAESRQLAAAFRDVDGAIEGPLGYDLAVSPHSAEVGNYQSRVSGEVDIFFTPDYISGTLLTELFKNWEYLGLPWNGADISFGGPVPMAAPSRTDTPEHNLRSIIAAAYISLLM